jgi:serine/threonine protein kinase
MRRYPRTLSSGANNTVIALSETEAGKMFFDDTRSEIGSEAEKMQFANAINGLVVKFIRFDEYDDSAMLVMERLMPLDYRAFEVSKRELIFDVFEDELQQLHKAGFVHRDLRRPSNVGGMLFDNIFLTPTGIRLIDVGISVMKSKVSERLFSRFVEEELKELEVFRQHFLTR